MKYSLRSIQKRLLALTVAVALLFAALFARLAFIQLANSAKLQQKAAEQWQRDLPITPERGSIVDRNGELLAGNTSVYTVYLRPNAVEDKAQAVSFLSQTLSLDKAALAEKVNGRNVSEITIARGVEKAVADRIIAQSLKGIYLSIDNERVYPNNGLLSQVLGYVSADNAGQAGLEYFYNDYLKGIAGKALTSTDLLGKEIEGESRQYLAAKAGMTLTLTIDADIQKIAENVLDQGLRAFNAKAARALVMDPNTGEILAMANLPTLDLNNLPRDDLATLNALSRNALAVDIYEPGSTFKIFTVAADLEEVKRGNKKAFSDTYVFRNNSPIRVVDGQIIKCWDKHINGKHANQDIQHALNNSCNPIFMDIALALGTETFYNYLEQFNFGKPTGLDFLGEQGGMLLAENTVKNCDLARIGFGQTVAVTPLQMLAGACAAINGGYYYMPHLVSQITSADGLTGKRVYPAMRSRPISEETSAKMRALLEGVVKEGSGRHAAIKGYRVGGKTGTAQKYENGKIAQGKYVSSFIGFFPANAPKYAALVIIDEPQGAHYGSTVAAPLCQSIFEQIIVAKGIKPVE